MKLVVWKTHSGSQIWCRSLDPFKKRRFYFNHKKFHCLWQTIRCIQCVTPKCHTFFKKKIGKVLHFGKIYPKGTIFGPIIKGYALGRPFLYFDHFHIFDLFCTSTSLLRPLYFDSLTSTSVLRHFVKSGLLIGREAQVEVKFWWK